MRLIFLGPPGAGKGTQARRVAAEFKIPALSTGDMLRAAVSEGSVLGRTVERILRSGELVPDGTINAVIQARLGSADCAGGFLLDGFPRTLEQAHFLDEALAESGVSLDAVLLLEVDEDELMRRLLGRASEEGRADDKEDVIRNRLRVYHEQTSPLLPFYRTRGLLREVAGQGSEDAVFAALMSALE